MYQYLIPAAIGAVGSLIQGKKKPPAYQAPAAPATPRPSYQAPTYQSGPQYQGANYQGPQYRAGPQFQSPGAYQAPTTQVNPMQGPLYQQLLGNFQQVQQGGSALPEAYRKSVLDKATRSLQQRRNLDEADATEKANAMGLLGSGGLQVRLGQMDQGYANEYANLEDSLMQADLGERNNLIQTLMGLQGQQLQLEPLLQEGAFRGYQSRADIADKTYSAGREESNRSMDFDLEQALRQYTSQSTNADRSYDAGRAEVDRSNQFNMDNARNAYTSESSNWDQQRSEQLGNAGRAYQSDLAQYDAGQQQSQNLWETIARLGRGAMQPGYNADLIQMLTAATGGGRAGHAPNAVSQALAPNPWSSMTSSGPASYGRGNAVSRALQGGRR